MSTSQQILLGNAPTGGYQIERSLRFNSADSAYLSWTPASAGNRKTWTWSVWVKRGKLANGRIASAGDYDEIAFSSDTLYIQVSNNNASAQAIQTTAVYRDPSAWYHIVVACDTTQATAANRLKLYVNGVEVTAFSTDQRSSITQNQNTMFANNSVQRIGVDESTGYFDGYLSEVNFIDGQALDPTSFGETNPTTGVWQPVKYTGTYGTNGFYLNFSDNASTTTLGDDLSGNGNDWTTNNFSVTAGVGNDSLVDTPTNYGTDTGVGGEVRGNYCTLNPLSNDSTNTLTNGNLDYSIAANQNGYPTSTFQFSSGKWYWECTVTSTHNIIGIVLGTTGTTTTLFTTGYGYYYSGNKYVNGVSSAYGASYTTNDVIGVAVDLDSGTPTITFYKNGSSQGAITIAAGTYKVGGGNGNSGATATGTFNFGQRPFAYTAPSGFKALVTTNLPTPTVVQGDDYFNTILYTGTGSSNARTGVGFQPDLVWIKERNASADHALYDAVRGVQQQLESNTTTDETTESTGLTAFGSDGFTVGSLAQVNTNNDTYVAWCWKESTTSKFDIVTYTGNGTARTISHNLGVVPNMIIVKARTTASTDQGWPVYHSANTANPETDYLLLNTTAATADLDTVWNDTAPTSSVFSVGTNALVNANNDTYVAYLFANVAGYSAFGSYTGNGDSTNPPFVYLGFRPRYVMVKRSDSAPVGNENWLVTDSTRSPYNTTGEILNPNTSGTGENNYIRFYSNGFTVNSNDSRNNSNGGTYIYAAFAENPFKYSLAR